MSRYCGVCGASLGMTSLSTGRCEQCNARVEASGPSIDERNLGAEDAPTLAGWDSAGDPASTHSSSRALPAVAREVIPEDRPVTPAPKIEEHRRSREKSPRVPLLWVLSLLLVVALLLTSGALFLLARSGSIPIIFAPSVSSNANSSSSSSSGVLGSAATATSGETSQGTGSSTQAVSGTATKSLAPTATPGPVLTSTPTPPDLSVTPTSFTKLVCPTSVQFTITNTGQAVLVWSASGPSGYTISPASGTVNGGDNVTVDVTTGLLGGTMTITASGAVNSPQQVAISCL